MTLLSYYCDPCEGQNQIAFSSRLISGSFHSTTSARDNHVESGLEKCGENVIFIGDIASPLLFEATSSRSLSRWDRYSYALWDRAMLLLALMLIMNKEIGISKRPSKNTSIELHHNSFSRSLETNKSHKLFSSFPHQSNQSIRYRPGCILSSTSTRPAPNLRGSSCHRQVQ